jgi:UDP-MurNAc hydroxylase
VRVTWHTNACVEISSSGGSSILCDPWTTEGAFLGSWFHWPPLADTFEAQLLNRRFDGIYISHLHPDHFDRRFLAKYLRRWPRTPIIIAKYAHPWLVRACKVLAGGNSRVMELEPGRSLDVSGIRLRIIPADQCNPRVCGTSIPCTPDPWSRGIDSVGVFEADGRTVVNANDALAMHFLKRLAPLIGKADLLMGHYGGASPYPQCFPEVIDRHSEGRKVVNQTCETLGVAANALAARFVLPFAGQYVLGGRLVSLNKDRATVPLDQAAAIVDQACRAEVVTLAPGGSIDFDSDTKDPDYVEPPADVLVAYEERLLSRRFPYENVSLARLTEGELERCAGLIIQRAAGFGLSRPSSFIIGDESVSVSIEVGPHGGRVRSGEYPSGDSVTRISMPYQLLSFLGRRRRGYQGFTSAHWNQADVGSHFIWRRSGEFDLRAHMLLNFFGA